MAIRRFWTKTHRHARLSLARLLKEYHNDPDNENPRRVARFRAELYAFSILLQYYSLETNLDFERRLEKLERFLEERTVSPYRAISQ